MTPSRKQSSGVPLRIDTVEQGGSLVLVVEGEVDIATSHLLDEAMGRALDTCAERIVVDLRAVTFIDSFGLQILVARACAEESGRRIRLTEGSPQTKRLFQLTAVCDLLEFVSD